MSFLPQLDAVIQQGRGVASGILGQPYNVYRLSTQSVNPISGTPLLTNFYARIERTTQRIDIENQTFDLLVYVATCDNRQLAKQDILVEQGYESDGSAFVFAQRRPTRDTLWVRTEQTATITRPEPRGGQEAQQPTSGATRAPGYMGVTEANESILTLTNGTYAWTAQPTTAAQVPCGIQPLNRIREASTPSIPTAYPKEHYLAYVPLLGAVTLRRFDRIVLPGGDRYEVALPYSSGMVGFTGWILVLDRLGG